MATNPGVKLIVVVGTSCPRTHLFQGHVYIIMDSSCAGTRTILCNEQNSFSFENLGFWVSEMDNPLVATRKYFALVVYHLLGGRRFGVRFIF